MKYYLYVSYDDQSGDGYRGDLRVFETEQGARNFLENSDDIFGRIISARIIEGRSIASYNN